MRCHSKHIGCAITTFGLGIIISSFIPFSAIVIIEGLVIIAAGVILFI